MTPQHLRALSYANKVRVARAELKRRVRANELNAAAVVLTNPPDAQSMTVASLLACQRGWGPEKTRRFLKTFSMSESRTVGSLVERERQAVASRLHGGMRALRDAEAFSDAGRWAASIVEDAA